MADYVCNSCGFTDGYASFKLHMSDEARDAEIEAQDAAYAAGEDEDGDDIECPECGGTSAVEL